MTTISLSEFQPFDSRVGHDTVLRLQFYYCPEAVEQIKSALKEARVTTLGTHLGGWLAAHKCWFIEFSAWPTVRKQLLRAGHRLIGDLPEYLHRAKANTKPEEPERADTCQRPPVLPMSTVRQGVQRWYAELSREFHPDRGGNHERMSALNTAHERLKSLLGV
jgi:hypothetical protein